MRIGVFEIIVILLIALLVFGGNKLGGVGKALGKSIREFKKEIKADDKDEKTEDTSDDGEKNA